MQRTLIITCESDSSNAIGARDDLQNTNQSTRRGCRIVISIDLEEIGRSRRDGRITYRSSSRDGAGDLLVVDGGVT